MSSSIHQRYQQLQQLLQQLQVSCSNQDVVFSTLEAELAQLQLLSQEISQALDGFAQSETTLRTEAIQTEISKQFRLLQTDLVFLKAARQAVTIQQRQQQMQTRLELLLNYCTGALAIWN